MGLNSTGGQRAANPVYILWQGQTRYFQFADAKIAVPGVPHMPWQS